MAVLHIIGSSSKGNSYAIETAGEILLLEAGCRFKDVQKGIDFKVGKISACLISHEHKDHAGFAKEFLNQGFPVMVPVGVANSLGDQFGSTYHVPAPLRAQTPGGFKAIAFNLPHGGTENYGYYIEHEEIGRLLFLTDFEYCKYSFKNQAVNHILIEANYSKEIISRQSINRDHVMLGHAEIGTTAEFVKANVTGELRSVILLHLSDGNSDETDFTNKIKAVVNPDVRIGIADAGKKFELNKEPF